MYLTRLGGSFGSCRRPTLDSSETDCKSADTDKRIEEANTSTKHKCQPRFEVRLLRLGHSGRLWWLRVDAEPVTSADTTSPLQKKPRMISRDISSTRQRSLDNDFCTIIIESILTAVHIFQSWSFPEAPELKAWCSYSRC